MASYKYLIVGGGMTAEAAVGGIREVDPDGSIGVIAMEPHPPYNRPPLTKGLWMGKEFETIWRAPGGVSAEWHSGRRAEGLDAGEKQVMDDQGNVHTYEKLLLATGGSPVKLPLEDDAILYYRTLDDYNRLRELSSKVHRFGVVGAGFIGSEIAAALAMNDQKVVMVYPEDGIGPQVFPMEISRYLRDYYENEKGVEMHTGHLVTAVERRGEELVMKLEPRAGGSATEVGVDAIVAGIGIRPNTDLAEAAGLEVENGVVVDERLRTSDSEIYAAGDVASFYNPLLDRRIRVEHEDNANMMGKAAGRNMAGADEPYHYLPYFYSDLFEFGYEAVGDVDSSNETFIDWEEPLKKGIIYYLQEGRVVGVLLWDVWGQVDAARELIAESGPFSPEDLKGRLP